MQRDEYQEMFGLSPDDLKGHILEYSDALRALEEASHEALPFDDFTFDLALCPYAVLTDAQTVDTSLAMIRELARVAKEVRIFPLSDTQGLPSPLLGPVLLGLNQENYGVEVRDVTSSRPSKGNAMLRVWAQQCQVS
ncbi:MAG TPA: hypothetical protein DDY37_05930 [Legionella sp.]|nr:hypothetical protein [Legionella sp.]